MSAGPLTYALTAGQTVAVDLTNQNLQKPCEAELQNESPLTLTVTIRGQTYSLGAWKANKYQLWGANSIRIDPAQIQSPAPANVPSSSLIVTVWDTGEPCPVGTWPYDLGRMTSVQAGSVSITAGSVNATIVGTTGNVPVSVQGTAQVNIAGTTGNIPVSIQGTAQVNIASQSGNVSVAISGTPTVILGGGSAVIGSISGISGTVTVAGTVNIGNTPSVTISSGTVNIGNVPTVNIGAGVNNVTGATVALNALNVTATVALAGLTGCGLVVAAGTLAATITPEVSFDGGTTWTASQFMQPSNGQNNATWTFTNPNAATLLTILCPPGTTNARVRVSAFTSGTANATLTATAANSVYVLIGGTPNVNIASGTVNIGNTPNVTIASGTVNATVAGSLVVSGTPTVNVQGSNVALIGAISGAALGDTGAATLSIDSVTETISATGGVDSAQTLILASFKAAAGQTIKLVGVVGAFTTAVPPSPPNNLNCSPTFGQATTAGNLLVAWVSCGNSAGVLGTSAAGWTKAVDFANGAQQCQIWYKLNCGAAEVAPVFNCTVTTSDFFAQLAEFSGAATVGALDQTGGITPSGGNSMTVTAGTVDAASGDLVLTASRWVINSVTTATFTDSINNSGVMVQAGQSGSDNRQSNFAYSILPTFRTALPLGVVPWNFDATGLSHPAGGSQATVTLAANATKKYTAHTLAASVNAGAAIIVSSNVELDDGATALFSLTIANPAAVTSTAGTWTESGLAYAGTVNQSMTFKHTAGQANSFQSCNLGAYLR